MSRSRSVGQAVMSSCIAALRRFFLAVGATAIVSLTSACSNPAAPALPRGESGPMLRIVADPVIDMSPGETRSLEVEERDGSGNILTRPLTAYAWNSSEPAVVTVGTDGALVARTVGGAAISARSGNYSATLHVWVQQPEHITPTYRITLVFSEDIPTTWHETFQWAASQYEKAIRMSLPGIELDGTALHGCGDYPGELPLPRFTGLETGTRIYIGRRPTPEPPTGNICLQRAWPRPTAVVGRITVGRDGNPDPIRIGSYLALHEMGHALGLVAGSTGIPLPWVDRGAGRYAGTFGLEGYRRQTGRSEAFLPIDGGHWDFPGDIMSATMPALWVTKSSVGALMDLGYAAAWYGAAR